jgi:hypothetical protein
MSQEGEKVFSLGSLLLSTFNVSDTGGVNVNAADLAESGI